jgi:hypothetical protein
MYPKCAKTHLQTIAISKMFMRVVPPTPLKLGWNRGRREGKDYKNED